MSQEITLTIKEINWNYECYLNGIYKKLGSTGPLNLRVIDYDDNGPMPSTNIDQKKKGERKPANFAGNIGARVGFCYLPGGSAPSTNSLSKEQGSLSYKSWFHSLGETIQCHGIVINGLGSLSALNSNNPQACLEKISKAFFFCIYSCLTPLEFQIIDSQTMVFLVPVGDPLTHNSMKMIECKNIGAFRRADKITFKLGSNHYSIIPSNLGKSYNGFYLNAGYYINGGRTLVHQDNQYLGVKYVSPDHTNASLTTKGPADSIDKVIIDETEGHISYYKLYNSNAADGKDFYYTKVNKNGNAISGAATAIGSISVPTLNINIPNFSGFNLPEFDYSVGAEVDTKNFISDFSKYRVKFIPVSYQDTQTTHPSMENSNSAIATFTNITSGVSNQDIERIRVKQSSFITSELEFLTILDTYQNSFKYSLTIKSKTPDEKGEYKTISLVEYFTNSNNRGKFDFIFTDKNNQIQNIDFKDYLTSIQQNLKYLNNSESIGYSFNVEMSLNQESKELNIRSLELFEAFTRGRDFIEENYTIVRPQERDPNKLDEETSRCMEYDENYFTYKYSGRDIDIFCQKEEKELCILPQNYKTVDAPSQSIYCALIHSADLLLESDVTLGETYGEQKYFIEAVKTPKWKGDNKQQINKDEIKYPTGNYDYIDSFKMVNYLEDGIDPTLYTEDDLEIVTSKIDLTRCKYYNPLAATFENNWCDCTHGGETNKECLYQKAGYCPYRFQSEKHPRRIRTLRQSKSNRFNLIQDLCKTFKFYPYFYIEHEKNGAVKLNENGEMLKHIFFMTEKGNNNAMGFRYEKNLSNTTRTIDSSAITTKLYVESVDSSYADDGLCSIQTATDNISRNSYILDFSYYIKMGMLDADIVQRDLYGIDDGDFAFLTRIGKFNEQYDEYSNLIITMTGQTLNELEAEIIVSTTGVTTALEERKKISQQMYQFKASSSTNNYKIDVDYTTSDTYINYLTKYREQATILWGLIETLFFSNNYFSLPKKDPIKDVYTFTTYNYEELQSYNYKDKESLPSDVPEWGEYTQTYCRGEFFWRLLLEGFKEDETYMPIFDHWNDCMEILVEPKLYEINGKLGKYRSLYNEVQYWKRERAKILNKINDLSEQFYHKYEPYLKEGTFTDSNFLTDNEYYWGGVSVLADSCEPKLTYTFSVIDISALPEYKDDYTFELADTTFVEDIDFFGINSHTGFPNKEQVLITTLTENLDNPSKNSIEVKNYTTSFDDLFGSITASVQSLTYNENVYKRASNFTAQQYVTTDSLQDTLDIGDLTLLDTAKQNIQLDEQGTEGNDINNTASQYKQTGEGIYFSTDGGETWDLGIGPKGINMDYAKFGSLDASKIQIVDGDYIYFLWDKDGLNAYRDPSASTEGLLDFARFNRYGLSLIENGNVRLRAGYEYRSNEFGSNTTGDYTQEIALKDQNIGFYLYNDSGQPIFKTETQSAYNDTTTDYSARLSLTGEMFVTNKILDTTTVENYNNVKREKVLANEWVFTSNVTISEYSGGDGDSDLSERYNIIKLIEDLEYQDFIILEVNTNNEAETISVNNNTFYLICQIIDSNSSDISITEKYPDAKRLGYVLISSGTFSANDTDDEFSFDITDLTKENVYNLINTSSIIIDGHQISFSYSSDEHFYYDVVNDNEVFKILTVTDTDMIYLPEQGQSQITVKEGEPILQTINYLEEQSDGSYLKKSKDLYAYAAYNLTTYWEKMTEGGAIGQWVEDFSLAEVGIFINNKKALRVSIGEMEDLTNLDNQEVSSDKDQMTEALKAILSGAERTFSIIAGGKDGDDNSVYKNILSVLKNGVLYLGGTVTDYYGTALDIENLSYLPDEIKINQPSLMMTTAGQMWCNWKKFFNILEEDGKWTPTSYSLQDVFDAHEAAIQELANGITQYFTDLSDALANASVGYETGYYIDDIV